MRTFLVVTGAAFYGLGLRLIFGIFGNVMDVMGLSFLIVAPALLGYMTVYFLHGKISMNGVGAFFLPWLTCFAVLVLTVVFSVEGSICWVMMFPIFAVVAGIAGLAAYHVEEGKKRDRRDNPPTILKSSFVLIIPLILGFAEGDRTNITKEITIEREVAIDASTSSVWKAISGLGKIEKDNKFSVSGLLGMPMHVKTESDSLKVGAHRNAIYEKCLVFNEVVTKCESEKLLVLSVRTDPAKIPANVLDEHVVIGGKHIKVLEDIYKLEALPGGKCSLKLSSRFTITTPLNFYASIWSDYLMQDVLNAELENIKKQAGKF